jgi:phosphoglycolate phosphatase
MENTDVIKLLIFDLDGTLIDSAPDIITATNILLTRRGVATQPDSVIIGAIGEGLKQFVFNLFPEVSGNQIELAKLERDFFELYEQHLLIKTKVYPGAIEFLENWRGLLAIVTNKNYVFAEQVVAGLPLHRFPWVRVFGADSLARRKPDPLPLIEAMKAAGVTPEETIMIGDGLPDMRAARAAGVRSIAIGFGYTNPQLLMNEGAAVLLNSFSELASVLENLPAL